MTDSTAGARDDLLERALSGDESAASNRYIRALDRLRGFSRPSQGSASDCR
jgi:hypothetical protein